MARFDSKFIFLTILSVFLEMSLNHQNREILKIFKKSA